MQQNTRLILELTTIRTSKLVRQYHLIRSSNSVNDSAENISPQSALNAVTLGALNTVTGNHKFRGSFEVNGSVNKKIMVFGNVTPCNLVERYWCYGIISLCDLQSRRSVQMVTAGCSKTSSNITLSTRLHTQFTQ